MSDIRLIQGSGDGVGSGFSSNVEGLPQNHALRSGCPRQRKCKIGAHITRADVRVAYQFKGQCLERVPGQNSRRLIPSDVDGGRTAPKVVIIHAWKIVMDQRIGVQGFDPSCGPDRSFGVDPMQACAFKYHEPTQAFATKGGVAHRLNDRQIAQIPKDSIKLRLNGAARFG